MIRAPVTHLSRSSGVGFVLVFLLNSVEPFHNIIQIIWGTCCVCVCVHVYVSVRES